MQFDFGANWLAFSRDALSQERARQAGEHFGQLLRGIELQGASFLDIGFGQGLGVLNAVRAGAIATGCDINPLCSDALEASRTLFPDVPPGSVNIVIGSVLDTSVISQLRGSSRAQGGFDVVHSWGVLHHTGAMRQAIANAASLVRPHGHFVIALYNRHWSSRIWGWIKWCYCKSPPAVQKLLVTTLYPVIWVAKWCVTGTNPAAKQRGMDFYYDVIDWVGGYPYEYASVEEVHALVEPLGFQPVRVNSAEVPTGCNEFVYRRVAQDNRTSG